MISSVIYKQSLKYNMYLKAYIEKFTNNWLLIVKNDNKVDLWANIIDKHLSSAGRNAAMWAVMHQRTDGTALWHYVTVIWQRECSICKINMWANLYIHVHVRNRNLRYVGESWLAINHCQTPLRNPWKYYVKKVSTQTWFVTILQLY